MHHSRVTSDTKYVSVIVNVLSDHCCQLQWKPTSYSHLPNRFELADLKYACVYV